MSAPRKCIIILSAKSSGSSALQNLLTSARDIQKVASTRHYENETLYWTKAASILERPQVPMLDSEVPIPAERAKKELIEFLQENVPSFQVPQNDEALVFGGWEALATQYAPIFLEKSPHHLLQWSCLELVAEAMGRRPDVEYLVIGLVRNPMDVIYSAWSRWRIYPRLKQYEWKREYENLLKARSLFGQRMVMLRYEDMVSDPESLSPILKFIGAEDQLARLRDNYLHKRSVAKWRQDKKFSFHLDPDVVALAVKLGYQPEAFVHDNQNGLWDLYQQVTRVRYRAWVPLRDTLRKVKYAVTP
jgi:hypothetical protein